MFQTTNPHQIGRIRQHAVAGCVALLCLMLAEPAFAQRDCQAPPGRSGLDQYCETVPGAAGDRSPGAGGGTGRDVSPATKRKLENGGAAGKALLGVLGAGARGDSGPGGDGGSASSGGGSGGRGGSSNGARSDRGSDKAADAESGSDKAADAPSNNVLSAIRSSADTGATSGPGFIWALVIVTLVIVGVAWIRYRARGRAG
jgi:hypothetical protein